MKTRTKWAAVAVLGLAPLALLAADEPANLRAKVVEDGATGTDDKPKVFFDTISQPTLKAEKAEVPRSPGFTSYYYFDSVADPGKNVILTEKTNQLVKLYANSSNPEQKTKAREELAKTVTEHFDVRHDARAKELKDLEEQVKRLRTLQEQRLAQKERIIKDRVDSLLLEADGLGWGKDSEAGKAKTQTGDGRVIEVPTYPSIQRAR